MTFSIDPSLIARGIVKRYAASQTIALARRFNLINQKRNTKFTFTTTVRWHKQFLNNEDKKFFVRLINCDDKRRTKSDDFVSTCGGEIQISDYRLSPFLLSLLRQTMEKGDTALQAQAKNKTNEFLISSLSIIETLAKTSYFENF